MGCTNIRGRN